MILMKMVDNYVNEKLGYSSLNADIHTKILMTNNTAISQRVAFFQCQFDIKTMLFLTFYIGH